MQSICGGCPSFVAVGMKNSPTKDLKSQLILKSFHASLPEAYKRLKQLGHLNGKNSVKVGDWEISMSQKSTDKYPAVMHAVHLKND